MRRIARIVAAFALLGFLVPASPAGAQDPTNEVNVVGFEYAPRATVVEAGDTVTWHNIEPAPIPHTVFVQEYITPSGERGTSPGLVCPDFGAGQSCSVDTGSGARDLKPGTYLYVCVVNPIHTATMQGVLEVL